MPMHGVRGTGEERMPIELSSLLATGQGRARCLALQPSDRDLCDQDARLVGAGLPRRRAARAVRVNCERVCIAAGAVGARSGHERASLRPVAARGCASQASGVGRLPNGKMPEGRLGLSPHVLARSGVHDRWRRRCPRPSPSLQASPS